MLLLITKKMDFILFFCLLSMYFTNTEQQKFEPVYLSFSDVNFFNYPNNENMKNLLTTFPLLVDNSTKHTSQNLNLNKLLLLPEYSTHLNVYLLLLNVTNNVLKYYSIAIITLGTLFNCVNFACFYRMKKRNSQNVYLSALSLADLFNIHVNLLVPLIRNYRRENNKNTNNNETSHFLLNTNKWDDLLCVLDGYLVEVGLLLPVWIMVILATERFLCIMWPLRKNIFCTPRKAKIILLTVILIILSWCLFKIGTAGVENDSTFKMHLKDESCRLIKYPTLVNISTTMWAIVPGVCCLVLNILIIKKIKLTTSPHKQFYPSERCKKINQTTRVVIALSIIFVILISPTGVLIILDIIINNSGKDLTLDKIKTAIAFKIARKYALLLYEINMIINLPIYLFTIKNFRETLRNFLPDEKLLRRKDSTEIGLKNNNNNFKQNWLFVKSLREKSDFINENNVNKQNQLSIENHDEPCFNQIRTVRSSNSNNSILSNEIFKLKISFNNNNIVASMNSLNRFQKSLIYENPKKDEIENELYLMHSQQPKTEPFYVKETIVAGKLKSSTLRIFDSFLSLLKFKSATPKTKTSIYETKSLFTKETNLSLLVRRKSSSIKLKKKQNRLRSLNVI